MSLSAVEERERGNITDETEVVNSGEYVAYASYSAGAWLVEYERGRKGGDLLLPRDGKFVVIGPWVGDGGELQMSINDTTRENVSENIPQWDYVELCDEPVFDLDR